MTGKFPPFAMVAGSVIAPTVKLGGAIVIAVRLMLEVPVLLIVNVCDELVEPTAWLGIPMVRPHWKSPFRDPNSTSWRIVSFPSLAEIYLLPLEPSSFQLGSA